MNSISFASRTIIPQTDLKTASQLANHLNGTNPGSENLVLKTPTEDVFLLCLQDDKAGHHKTQFSEALADALKNVVQQFVPEKNISSVERFPKSLK